MAPRKRKAGRRGDGGVNPRKNAKGEIIGFEAAVRINGRTVRRLAADPAAAEELRQQLIRQRDRKIDVAAGSQRLQDWANSWYEQKARTLKPTTLAGYKAYIQGDILPVFGKRPLNQITAPELQGFLNRVHDEIKARGRYDGTRAVRQLGSLLWGMFETARKQRLIDYNPMSGVELPKVKKARISPPTDAQLAAILEAAHNAPFPALWHLYGLLGLRRGEALGLRWSDVDFEHQTITIGQQVQGVPGRAPYVDTPKSEAGQRVLPAPPVIFELLRAWRPVQAAQRLQAGTSWQDQGLVFAGADGGPFWPASVDRWWSRLRVAAGVPATIKLHHLRHMVSTLCDEAGASEALKASILGHETSTITLHYTHARLAAMRRVLLAVADRVLRRSA